ncbi:MAG: hypothetical protein HYX92_10055 [Chloroflexi bacterium]|nr:hypothetical protein [Chloroflexota bacterium]
MHGEFAVALVLAIPIISFPLILWYSDIDRGYAALYAAKEAWTGVGQWGTTAGAGQRGQSGRQGE